jgi:NitT/TauT family transport system permease protein
MTLRARRLAAHVTVVLVALSAWHYAPNSMFPQDLVSRPAQVVPRLATFIASGEFFVHMGATTSATVLGVAVGAVLGTAIAMLAPVPFIGHFVEGLMQVGYAIPKVVLIAIFVLFLGIGTLSQLVLIVSFVMFVLYFNVSNGLAELDDATRKSLHIFGAGRLAVMRIYVFPSMVGYVFSGLRVALPLAYSVAVFAELAYGGETGIGAFIAQSARTMQPSGTIVGVICAGLLGYCLDRLLVRLVDRRAMKAGTGAIAV